MTIQELRLENGKAASYAANRTVMSETGLPANTEIEFVGKQSRWHGTGCSNSLYRIVGTDDLLLICHNDGPIDNLQWDNVIVNTGYFAERANYAKEVGILAKKYNIPFDVCLALGNSEELYKWFITTLKTLPSVSSITIDSLQAGINRRKNGLLSVLGEDLFKALKIESMGQKNSKRIADYVLARCKAIQQIS